MLSPPPQQPLILLLRSKYKDKRQNTKKNKDKTRKTKPQNAAPCSITTTYSSFWLKTPEHFLAERQPLFTRSSIQLHYHYIFTTTTIQFLLITRCATATLSQQSLRISTAAKSNSYDKQNKKCNKQSEHTCRKCVTHNLVMSF